ncbi:MAG: multiheme c-type cytochrome [Bacteroidota bacterium]|nr:multiheme c-type cytochrome [Bacteroidota bacterium]
MRGHSGIRVVFLFTALSVATYPSSAQNIAIKRMARSPASLGSFPNDRFPVSTGLRIVPLSMNVYLQAVTSEPSVSWSFEEKPTGSHAAFDDPQAVFVKFSPDIEGRYIVKVSASDTARAYDTLLASTFVGLPATGIQCGTCHRETVSRWQATGHATMFTRGISGMLRVKDREGKLVGVYRPTCIPCHTTGWDRTADNGNFGNLAARNGFDTAWYQGYPEENGDILIPNNETAIILKLTTSYPSLTPVAAITCESCHGPGKAHLSAHGRSTIGLTYEAGPCLQCHDAPPEYLVGRMWTASRHAAMPNSGAEAARSACMPCHNGMAFVIFSRNPSSPNYNGVVPVASISCVVCHDPHPAAGSTHLRSFPLPALANGAVIPDHFGGKGRVCMSCHRARENTAARVESQLRVFRDRFYPHYSPQTDMYVGANGFEYDLPIAGVGTHQGLTDGCVACHMYARSEGGRVTASHEMSLVDQHGRDIVEPCKPCHGDIGSFDDITASSDFDGDGDRESVRREIQGLLERLKSLLPKGTDGEPLCMLADFRKDSMAVKANPAFYPAIMNYYFVKYDGSMGVHNSAYAIALLQASLARLTTGVRILDRNAPSAFALLENRPNPTRHTAWIDFSVARGANVFIGVYNSMGRLVATLVDGFLPPGTYTTAWHAAALPSGTYFCRMTTNGGQNGAFSCTRKLVVLR